MFTAAITISSFPGVVLTGTYMIAAVPQGNGVFEPSSTEAIQQIGSGFFKGSIKFTEISSVEALQGTLEISTSPLDLVFVRLDPLPPKSGQLK
jgi:hypothetical protein